MQELDLGREHDGPPGLVEARRDVELLRVQRERLVEAADGVEASRGISMAAPDTQSTSRSVVRSQPSISYRRVNGLSRVNGDNIAWNVASTTLGNRRPLAYTVPSGLRIIGPTMPAAGCAAATPT